MFIVAILGLGLMGGSLGYALRGFRGCLRLGYDIDPDVTRRALDAGAVDETCVDEAEAVSQADLSILCMSPAGIIDCISRLRGFFRPGSTVTEIGGVKEYISFAAEKFLPETVQYIGIHPMAGKELSGFSQADAAIFVNSGFLIVPPARTSSETVELMQELADHIGASRVTVTDVTAHDRIIAWSSALMHLSAFALCHGIPENYTGAFGAGALRDATRVASSDPTLWTELFLDNRAWLLSALDGYVEELAKFRAALNDEDEEVLYKLLKNANEMKKILLVR